MIDTCGIMEILRKLDICSQQEVYWFATQVEKLEKETLIYKEGIEEIQINAPIEFNKRGRWGECLVARYFEGKLATNSKQEGWDVIDINGDKYQVKTKEAFLEDFSYDPIKIPLTKSSSHDFDYLVVIGITVKTKGYVETRVWTKEEVVQAQGMTTYFNLRTKARWETGEKINLNTYFPT